MEITIRRPDRCIVHWPGEEPCQNPPHQTIGIGITHRALGLVALASEPDEVMHLDVPMCMDCSHRLREMLPMEGGAYSYLSVAEPDEALAKLIEDKRTEIESQVGTLDHYLTAEDLDRATQHRSNMIVKDGDGYVPVPGAEYVERGIRTRIVSKGYGTQGAFDGAIYPPLSASAPGHHHGEGTQPHLHAWGHLDHVHPE